MAAIKAHEANIGYGSRVLCSGISFTVEAGDCILLCGANGSGKSTLLRAISEGAEGFEINAPIAMIPTRIPKVKGFTLREFVSTSLYRESSWRGRIGEELDKKISESLAMLGLSELEDRDISTLSDGEFQKGTIAAALCKAGRGGVVLLDEPTAFLDPENKIMVFRTLRDIADKSGTSFIYSTHDIAAALPSSTCAWAIGRDGAFRANRETKNSIISSIFSDKSLIFGNLTDF